VALAARRVVLPFRAVKSAVICGQRFFGPSGEYPINERRIHPLRMVAATRAPSIGTERNSSMASVSLLGRGITARDARDSRS
jgi:hypothetical protein